MNVQNVINVLFYKNDPITNQPHFNWELASAITGIAGLALAKILLHPASKGTLQGSIGGAVLILSGTQFLMTESYLHASRVEAFTERSDLHNYKIATVAGMALIALSITILSCYSPAALALSSSRFLIIATGLPGLILFPLGSKKIENALDKKYHDETLLAKLAFDVARSHFASRNTSSNRSQTIREAIARAQDVQKIFENLKRKLSQYELTDTHQYRKCSTFLADITFAISAWEAIYNFEINGNSNTPPMPPATPTREETIYDHAARFNVNLNTLDWMTAAKKKKTLKKAYHSLMLENHPDKFLPEERARQSAISQKISNSYSALLNYYKLD